MTAPRSHSTDLWASGSLLRARACILSQVWMVATRAAAAARALMMEHGSRGLHQTGGAIREVGWREGPQDQPAAGSERPTQAGPASAARVAASCANHATEGCSLRSTAPTGRSFY